MANGSDRIWHCPISSHPDRVCRPLPALPPLPVCVPSPAAAVLLPDLFLLPEMAAHRSRGSKGVVVVYIGHTGNMVDRFADRRGEERVNARTRA